MSLETLHSAQQAAVQAMDIDPAELRELQTVKTYSFMLKTTTGLEVPAYRIHTGAIEGAGGKGGIRFDGKADRERAVSLGSELSAEMFAKNALWGVRRNGAKGIICADPRLPESEMTHLTKQYAQQMHDAGLGDYRRDSPAGDIGSNGLADTYALEMRRLGEPYWQASITGKSVELGGSPARPAATARGAYAVERSHRRMTQDDSLAYDVATQGWGNVGGWRTYFASQDHDSNVTTISDQYGALYSDGVPMDIREEYIHELADNRDFKGDKMAELSTRLKRDQGLEVEYVTHAKDPYVVFKRSGDLFVPAALADSINEKTAPMLVENNVRVVEEAANGPTKKKAHDYLVEHGVWVLPDVLVNGGGVNASMDELYDNVAAVDHNLPPSSKETLERSIVNGATSAHERTMKMAEKLGTKDLRVAAVAVSLAQLGVSAGLSMDPSFHDFAIHDAA